MVLLNYSESKAWEKSCDYWDRPRRCCVWYDSTRFHAVRYYTETAQCSLYEWKNGTWGPTKSIPVLVHEPAFISAVAKKELGHGDQGSESKADTAQ